MWVILFLIKNFKLFNKFSKFENLLKFLSKRLIKTFKHFGKHITVNTIDELEKAKKISTNLIK